MKRILLLTLALVFNLSVFSQVTEVKTRKQLRADKKAKIEKSVKELLESNRFSFIVRTAIPAIGPSITLNTDYEIKIVHFAGGRHSYEVEVKGLSVSHLSDSVLTDEAS